MVQSSEDPLILVVFVVVWLGLTVYAIRAGTRPIVEAIDRLTREVGYANQRADEARREGTTDV